MRKILSLIYVILILSSPIFSQEELQFLEYDRLNPEINVLSERENSVYGKNILLHLPLASFHKHEIILLYNTTTMHTSAFLPEQLGIEPGVRFASFWDVSTKDNYVNKQYLTDTERNNWNRLILKNDNQFALQIESESDYWAHRSLPYLRISSSRVLTSQYIYELGRESTTKSKSVFKITDTTTNNTVWEDVAIGLPFADLYRISDEWLLRVKASHMAGHYETNTIFNSVYSLSIRFLANLNYYDSF
jgi:hypothetical protein